MLFGGWNGDLSLIILFVTRLIACTRHIIIIHLIISLIIYNNFNDNLIPLPLNLLLLLRFFLFLLFWLFICSLKRNENNQLLLGIRRANRSQTFMPSSVLSSDSMHIGLLAAAAHAAATNSRFTIFYNPRCVSKFYYFRLLALTCLVILFSGLVHLSLWYLWLSMPKQFVIPEFLWGCAFGCCLKQRSPVSVGMSKCSCILNACSKWEISPLFF